MQEEIVLGCINKAKNGVVRIINMFAIIQNFQTHLSITHRLGIDCLMLSRKRDINKSTCCRNIVM